MPSGMQSELDALVAESAAESATEPATEAADDAVNSLSLSKTQT